MQGREHNHPEIQRCREEQIQLASLLLAGHPQQHGLRMAVTDWFLEELLLEVEKETKQ
jgi:hypothetical protein